MKDKLFPGLVVLCLLVMSWLIYDLKSEVQGLKFALANRNEAANTVNALNAPLLAIQQNQVGAAAGLHYLELLAEGMARKSGLPIEQAREAFKKRRDGVPPGWNWNAAWEGAAPVESPPPAK